MTLFHAAQEQGRQEEFQKWDYINLSDFNSGGFGAIASYTWLWLMAIISVSVYVADTFTAVNLLAFNRWSGSFQPTIPLDYAKWIFAACIILSWLLCGYDWFRALMVMRKNSVSKDYLDPMAVNLQSLRVFGKNGQGYRRFLVFAGLTKSRKGADYVALFVYFQFRGAIRILLAEGPRQVVNGLTLFSFMFAHLNGKNAGSDIQQFWINMETLAGEHREQAVILWSMAFTFVIWAFSLISFLIACILYVGFLWHYIPAVDGSLSKYCRRKIEKRLAKMVSAKVEETLRKQNEKLRKEAEKEEKAKLKAGAPFAKPTRQPTLPSLFGNDDDASSISTTLTRSETKSSLLAQQRPTRNGSKDSTNAPSLLGEPTLPTIIDASPRPPGPSRTFTSNSNLSQSTTASDRPLLSATGPPGMATRPTRRPLPGAMERRPSTASDMSAPINSMQQQPRSESPWAPERAATASPEMMRRGPQAMQMGSRPPPQRLMTTDGIAASQYPPRPSTANSFRSEPGTSMPRSHMNASIRRPPMASPVPEEFEMQSPSQMTPAPVYATPQYRPLTRHDEALRPLPNQISRPNFTDHENEPYSNLQPQPPPTAFHQSRSMTPNYDDPSADFQRPPPPRRVGTAPLPALPSANAQYDTSVIDAYSRPWHEQDYHQQQRQRQWQEQQEVQQQWNPPPRHILPQRPGTAGPRMY